MIKLGSAVMIALLVSLNAFSDESKVLRVQKSGLYVYIWNENKCLQVSETSYQSQVISLEQAKSKNGCSPLSDYSEVEKAYAQNDQRNTLPEIYAVPLRQWLDTKVTFLKGTHPAYTEYTEEQKKTAFNLCITDAITKLYQMNPKLVEALLPPMLNKTLRITGKKKRGDEMGKYTYFSKTLDVGAAFDSIIEKGASEMGKNVLIHEFFHFMNLNNQSSKEHNLGRSPNDAIYSCADVVAPIIVAPHEYNLYLITCMSLKPKEGGGTYIDPYL